MSAMHGIHNFHNSYSGYVQGHPLIEIPVPHEAEHPGLAQFTSASIIPCLRFYSFTFRILIIFALALLVISRPLFQLIRKYGLKAPEVFRNQTGLNTFHANYRANQDTFIRNANYRGGQEPTLLEQFILASITKW
jgi:hypothetical protein